MKFTPVEWSPHLFTQLTKDDTDDAVVVEVVSVETSTSSSPIRRRDSTGSSSFSSTNSLSCSSSSFLDDTSISFQSLSLQQPIPNEMMGANEKENRANKRRIVKAIRISNASSRNQQEYTSPPPPQDISPVSVSWSFPSYDKVDDGECKINLQTREQSLFCSIESRTIKTRPSSSDIISSETPLQPKESLNLLSFGSLQASSTLARSKRQRGGSDLCMVVADGGEPSGNTTISSVDRYKRRRFNRNRAMNAQEFDTILSQISKTGYLSVEDGIF